MPKTVAVIGAGPSGLAAIKCSLDAGLKPITFESDPWLGGTWKYTDLTEETERRSCVAYSTITNTSKHMSCYSDFPMPKEWPNYLPRQKYLEYFQMYAKHFNLEETIRFNSKVTAVEPCPEFSQTGRWRVHYWDKKLNEERDEEFNFVMVCTGVNWDPRVPEIPGVGDFNGDVIHSKEYRTWKKYEGKRVIVLGMGNSAGDIACELSHHSSQVYLSGRSGTWVVSRLGFGGEPIDVQFINRLIEAVPSSILSRVYRHKLEEKLDITNFGLGVEEPPDKRYPVINDELPNRILTGSIQVRVDIAKIQGNTVYFTDGSRVEKIDAIILATGFKFSFPFLSNALLHPQDKYIPLYKYVFPPTLHPSTLAIIGAIRVNGPVPPIVELQSRWATSVFAGSSMLPDCQTMVDDVGKRQKLLEANTMECCRAFHLVKYIGYSDELSSLIGAKPNLWHLLKTDPELACKCYFGPCVPAQYRLMGQGAWEGARDVIVGVQESRLFPLRTRKMDTKEEGNKMGSLLWLLPLLVAAVLYLFVNCF